MFAASFGPEVVEEEGSEDVERLSPVREATGVVALEVRGVVLLFEDSFPHKDERPGDGEAVGRLPFIPSATESIPRLLGGRAIHEAMLGRLRKVLVATFAGGLEPHGLEPRAHREPFVEGQPDEGSHFAWAGVVPDPSNNLGSRGVPEARPLDEFNNPGGVSAVFLRSGIPSRRSSRRKERPPCCAFVASASLPGPIEGRR